MNYGAIIPAFNAGASIVTVIAETKNYLNGNIIVVNDGSTDDTEEIARATKVIVLSHSENIGKGGALKTGFKKALSLGWDGVITLDADGQHEPKFIPHFVALFETNRYEIVIGSRMNDISAMPFHRILSNKITSFLVSIRTGQKISDSQSGYRFIKSDSLRKLKLTTNHYDTETEILLKSGLMGFRIGCVNINTVYNDEPSSMRLMVDTVRFIKLYGTSLFW